MPSAAGGIANFFRRHGAEKPRAGAKASEAFKAHAGLEKTRLQAQCRGCQASGDPRAGFHGQGLDLRAVGRSGGEGLPSAEGPRHQLPPRRQCEARASSKAQPRGWSGSAPIPGRDGQERPLCPGAQSSEGGFWDQLDLGKPRALRASHERRNGGDCHGLRTAGSGSREANRPDPQGCLCVALRHAQHRGGAHALPPSKWRRARSVV
mmetsp:Transcript_80400/g.192815  ORF Transcript_80400/g.192815 Transcript_80400/m.192815 type:complete len:207 (+) Transcript_80400:1843-2463(+)